MKGASNGPIGTILAIILVLFKIREGSVLLHRCLGRRLEAELKNVPSYTAPPPPPVADPIAQPQAQSEPPKLPVG